MRNWTNFEALDLSFQVDQDHDNDVEMPTAESSNGVPHENVSPNFMKM